MDDPDKNHENRRENVSINESTARSGGVAANTASALTENDADTAPALTENDADTAPALPGYGALTAPALIGNEADIVNRFEAVTADTEDSVDAAPVETGRGNRFIAGSKYGPIKPLSSYSHALRKKAESVVTPVLLSLSAWFFGYFGLSFAWIVVLFLLLLLIRRIRAEKDKTFKTAPIMTFSDDAKRVEWVNEIAAPLWPYLGRYAAKVAKGKVESQIRQKLDNFGIRQFSFDEISLGDVAPSIGGVKVNINLFFILLVSLALQKGNAPLLSCSTDMLSPDVFGQF